MQNRSRTVYRLCLDSRGLQTVVRSSGAKCLESAFDVAGSGFDIIVLDTRIADIASSEVAARIRARSPGQRIVFTTTSEQEMKLLGEKEEVLIKPFKFSQLLSMI